MAKKLLACTYIGAPVGLGIVDSLDLCAYSKGLCDDERVSCLGIYPPYRGGVEQELIADNVSVG